MEKGLLQRALVECFGTFWLVFGGVGSAVIAGTKIGYLGVAIAFGLTVLTMAYAAGHVSGCHLNPAVTLGLVVGRRVPASRLLPYWIAQLLGAFIASWVILLIAQGLPGFDMATSGLGANGYGDHSPSGYSLGACFLAEVVLTFFFVLVIMGSTSKWAPMGFAPCAIGLALTLVHLVGIPITNTSVNPARSTGPALIVGGWALKQLWLFWLAPLIGGALGGLAGAIFRQEEKESILERK